MLPSEQPFLPSLAEPAEFPADREKPDLQKRTVAEVADAEQGPQGLIDGADGSSGDVQIGDALMEDATGHDEREDQDANRGQDTASIRDTILCEKPLSSSREGGVLFLGGGRDVE